MEKVSIQSQRRSDSILFDSDVVRFVVEYYFVDKGKLSYVASTLLRP
jgi:hypothetical protein